MFSTLPNAAIHQKIPELIVGTGQR
jgi:hypothetical protein